MKVYALINDSKIDRKKTISLELIKGDNKQLIVQRTRVGFHHISEVR